MAQNTLFRELRVFISSTFNDLQEERKVLMSSVFPKLVSIAAERGVVLTPIDLRWGVVPRREGKSRSAQIIDACLKEIDKAQCFIGIVGEREGWLPDTDDLGKSDLLKGEFEELVHSGMSMTEIEMQYGVLRRKERGSAFFFVKEIEDGSPVSNGRLRNELYRKEKELGYTLRGYSDAGSLSKLVEEAVLKTLDSVYPGNLSQDEKVDIYQQYLIRSHTNVYISDESLFQSIDEGLEKSRCVCISGDQGKSALLANWIVRTEKNTRMRVASCFIPKGRHLPPEQIDRRLCREVSRVLGLPLDESLLETSPYELLEKICLEVPVSIPLVLAIDGIEEQPFLVSRWISKIPSTVKFIYSSFFWDQNVSFAENHDYPIIIVRNPPLKRVLYIQNYLKHYGKDLDGDLVHYVAETLPGEFRTLRAMLDILILFGKHDNIRDLTYSLCQPSEHTSSWKVNPDSDFFQSVIVFYENYYADLPVKDILAAIAFVTPGIRETEIADFVGTSSREWLYFKSGFSPFLGIDDGFITTTVDGIKGALSKLHPGIAETTLKRAARYFGKKDVFCRKSYNLSEFFLIEKDIDSFISSLLDIDYFMYLRENDYERFSAYWDKALSGAKDRKPLAEFGELLISHKGKGASRQKKKNRIFLLLAASRFCIDHYGNSSVALPLARKALDVATETYGGMGDETFEIFTPIMRAITESLFMEGKYDEAYDLSNKVIDTIHQSFFPLILFPDVGMCLRIRAEIHSMRGQHEDAINDIQEAKRILLHNYGHGHEDYIKCRLSEGRIRRAQGEHELAMDCFQVAIWLTESYIGPIHRSATPIFVEMSYSYLLRGKIFKAVDYIHFADLDFITYDQAHAHYVYGLILFKKWYFEAAMDEFNQSADILERIDRTGDLYSSARERIDKCNKRLWYRNLFKRKNPSRDA